MRFYFNVRLLLGLITLFLLATNATGNVKFDNAFLKSDQDETTVSFNNDIRPILESSCLRCHNEIEPEAGYRIDNRDDAMDYVEAGDADSSDLYQCLITDEEDTLMPPPDEGGPLDDSDIQLVKTWINEGASWPVGIRLQQPVDDSTETGNKTAENSAEEMPAVGVDNARPSIFRAIGSLHPATLHIPIGLLLAAGLFALLSLRGNFVMSDCAYYCLWLGAMGAIVACLTGWWFTLVEYPKEYVNTFEGLQDMNNKLFWHRTTAVVATVFSLLLALFAASARNRDPDDGVAWKLGLILLAIGIGFVGHQGGELTWKASHYDELWEVVGEYIPGLSEVDRDLDDSNESTETDAKESNDDEMDGASGETSEPDDSEET